MFPDEKSVAAHGLSWFAVTFQGNATRLVQIDISWEISESQFAAGARYEQLTGTRTGLSPPVGWSMLFTFGSSSTTWATIYSDMGCDCGVQSVYTDVDRP